MHAQRQRCAQVAESVRARRTARVALVMVRATVVVTARTTLTQCLDYVASRLRVPAAGRLEMAAVVERGTHITPV